MKLLGYWCPIYCRGYDPIRGRLRNGDPIESACRRFQAIPAPLMRSKNDCHSSENEALFAGGGDAHDRLFH
jgi:hypothetical protein